LEIKETFSNLQNKKIENIQKIIRSENKPKPKLNIITKETLRKQVIVPINNNNKTQFIKESSAYVANINRVLKKIKLEIIANSVQSEKTSIVITTNKVAAPLDL